MPLSAQQFLEIKEIKEGVVILKNNTLRGILMVSSLNFALESTEEQETTLYQFQQFLNSLDFSAQILIQSRRLNITSYLDKLDELKEKQKNELLKIQTADYKKFIEGLVKRGGIMTKNFYVMVPYSVLETKESVSIKKLTKIVAPSLSETDFQGAKNQLWQRMEFLGLGLRRCGLNSVPLTTPELIELFWSLYHPRQAEVGYYPEVPPEMA